MLQLASSHPVVHCLKLCHRALKGPKLLPMLCSLGLLACRLQKDNVETLLQDLCSKLSTGKEHQRDLASIGLKTVVAEASGPQLASTVVNCITPHLIAGIRKQVLCDI